MQHIAFIMDGNGRWATARGLTRLEGHHAGVKAMQDVVQALLARGIPYASFYAFSTENWKRPPAEVKGLMMLLRDYLNREFNKLIESGVRLRVIGDIGPDSPVPAEVRHLLEKAVLDSTHNTKLTLGLCFNYGGRNELTRAVKKLVEQGIEASEITEERISAALDTAEFPDPDLLIRTSGEARLSNFMPWQTAYTELYFDPTYWPDFDAVAMDKALAAYSQRDRRFGTLPVSPKKRAEG